MINDEVRQAVSDLLRSITTHSGGGWSESATRDVFRRLVDEQWTRVGLSEDLGGSGGDVGDAAAVATACAASAHLLPLPDMVIVTEHILELASMRLPASAGCVIALGAEATADPSGGVHLEVGRVPWGRWASHFLVLAADSGGTAVHLVDAAITEITPGCNLAGEPRDRVTIAGAQPVTSTRIDRPAKDVISQVELAGGLARSIQIAAACESVLSMTVAYCSERRQFGRRLVDFQAVQQELAALKGESAAAGAAVDHALDALTPGDPVLPVARIAAAKIRTGLAAGAVARFAHQLHGAIGITQEYALHRYTTSLWSWRDEYGGESHWAAKLLTAVASDVPARPWERLTAV